MTAFSCFSPGRLLHGQSLKPEDIGNVVRGGSAARILKFYEQNQFRFIWLHSSQRIILEDFIKRADELGLEPSSYPIIPLTGSRRQDSLATEISYAAGAILMAQHLHAGNKRPEFRFEGLEYRPDTTDFTLQLLESVRSSRLTQFFIDLQPQTNEYKNALSLLRTYLKTAKTTGFSDFRIRSTMVDTTNRNLIARLIQLSFLDKDNPQKDTGYIRRGIRMAQAQFSLPENGSLSASLIRALNLPLQDRIEELQTMINFLRWSQFPQKKETTVILNIPSAELRVTEKGKRLLSSRVVVGKTSARTPTLTSRIDEIILYPYWQVPHKIATHELLPLIRKDVSYLERNAYQVLNSSGRIMNPRSVPWHSLGISYFPYTLRQATGCDNSLGVVKFDFKNPFSVFLHDSPAKSLFAKRNRFYSHGCMRVEKAIELAHILLGDNRIAVDTLTQKGCLTNQQPIPVSAKNKASMVVTYQTCWFDDTGNIRFHDDIYKKTKR